MVSSINQYGDRCQHSGIPPRPTSYNVFGWTLSACYALVLVCVFSGLAGAARGVGGKKDAPPPVPEARPYCPLCDPNADPNTWAIDGGWDAVWPLPKGIDEHQSRDEHLVTASPAQQRAFAILRYPYVAEGLFTRKELVRRTPSEADPNVIEATVTPAGGESAGDPLTAAPSTAPNRLDPNTDEPARCDDTLPADVMESYLTVQTCCDLIHQWRCFNESVQTAQEVLWARALTKRSTGIYRIAPELAVAVRRTAGQMGRLNRRFDATSRLILEDALEGHTNQQLLSRLEKQAKDLVSLREHLAGQNDLVSAALGHGKLARSQVQIVEPEPVVAAPTDPTVAAGRPASAP